MSTNIQISTTLQGTLRELFDFKILKQLKICMQTWRLSTVSHKHDLTLIRHRCKHILQYCILVRVDSCQINLGLVRVSTRMLRKCQMSDCCSCSARQYKPYGGSACGVYLFVSTGVHTYLVEQLIHMINWKLRSHC